jgi:hypothetical protein
MERWDHIFACSGSANFTVATAMASVAGCETKVDGGALGSRLLATQQS